MEVLLLKWVFAWASVILVCLATIPYLVSIKNGKTKPPYSTYIGWTLVGFTMVFFQYQTIASEASNASMVGVVAFAITPFCVLMLMIFVRVPWTMERRDIVSFLGLGICWTFYVVLRLNGYPGLSLGPMVALAVTDGFSSWPTFQDCRSGKQSSTLERCAWGMTGLAALCELAAVGNYGTSEMFIPAYLAVYMCAIASASFFSSPTEDAIADIHATPAE